MKERQALSKEDIKSLFLGILKLVQKEAENDAMKTFGRERKILSQKLLTSQKKNDKSIKIIEKLEMENKKLINNYNNLSTYLSGLKVDFDKVKMEKLRNYFKDRKNSQKEENNIE